MHVISQRRLKEFWAIHPDSEGPSRTWYKLITQDEYTDFAKLRGTFSSASKVKNFIVFNIGGNKYRLIAYADFESQKVFIRHILTHADYDTDGWKDDDWYD